MNKKRALQKKLTSNQLRVIAGQWRGSNIAFADGEGLRPTPARVRETVFNWLAPSIEGAQCLDLFAGSGALSFEALSRGALSVVAIETNRLAVAAMAAGKQRLGANGLQIVCQDALRWLAARVPATGQSGTIERTEAFDIVFLDPPFVSELLGTVIEAVVAARLLAPGALIYIEMPGGQEPPAVPASWQRLRDKRAGNVSYLLYRVVPC